MTDNCKISVIVPVYNVEKYLKQSLNSIINQTLKDIEIICVDDCSTDNSYNILQQYAKKDDRIIVLKQEINQGQGVARNRALDIAKGEYIMFLDPDDWIELNACELCYNQITKNQNDLVLFGYNKFYESTGIYKPQTKTIDVYKKVFDNPRIDLNEYNKNYIISCYNFLMIYKKELFNKYNIRYSNFRNFEDHEVYIKAILHSDTISIINKVLYNYRVRNDSVTYLYNNQADDLYNSRRIILEELEKYHIEGNKKKAVYVNTLKSCALWYKRYSKMFPKMKKHLYENLRKLFLCMDDTYIKEVIKEKISEEVYNTYSEIRNKDYFNYKLSSVPSRIKDFLYSNNDANDGIHSIINIAGIKFKWIKNLSFINMLSFYNMTQVFFPEEEEKEKFFKLCKKINERKLIYKVQKNYKRIIKRIRKKKGKIKVLFLVNSINNWKNQSLYNLLANSSEFEPIIAVTILDKIKKLKPSRIETLDNLYNYFAERGMNVVYAFKENEHIDVKELEPDIVFYEKPYSEENVQHPFNVGMQALICYIPSNINSYNIEPADYNKVFYKYIYKHYLINKAWEILYKKISERKNFCGIGNPVLDYIYLNKDNVSENKYVIYAPDNTINHSKDKKNIGTFLKNGKEILEFAKSHPEINWAFIPHKGLKKQLKAAGKSKEDINAYYEEWEKFAKCCYDNSYTELFFNSRAIITDMDSVLTEYFCTGKPIINLVSKDCKTEISDTIKPMHSTFYKVKDLDEMYDIFNKVVINNDDYLKETRREILAESGLTNNYAAENIMKDFLKIIKEDKK